MLVLDVVDDREEELVRVGARVEAAREGEREVSRGKGGGGARAAGTHRNAPPWMKKTQTSALLLSSCGSAIHQPSVPLTWTLCAQPLPALRNAGVACARAYERVPLTRMRIWAGTLRVTLNWTSLMKKWARSGRPTWWTTGENQRKATTSRKRRVGRMKTALGGVLWSAVLCEGARGERGRGTHTVPARGRRASARRGRPRGAGRVRRA